MTSSSWARGEHDHGQLRESAQGGEDLKAVQIGHVHIQDHQVKPLRSHQTQGLAAGIGGRDLEALAGEAVAQQVGQVVIVVDAQYTVIASLC